MLINDCTKLPIALYTQVYERDENKNNNCSLEDIKVSGLQLKVDGTWKIRISYRHEYNSNSCKSSRRSVSDYTIDQFNRYFYIKEGPKE